MHKSLSAPVRRSPDGERSATWLELFFDLVFVVTVAALSVRLEHHFDWTGVATLLFIFLPVWWLWMEFSYYADLFDDNATGYQWGMILAMAGTVQLAVILRAHGLDHPNQIAACYLYLGGISWLLYGRAYLSFPELRWFTRRFLGCIGLSLGCWAASLFVEPVAIKYILWVVGVAVQMAAAPSIYLFRKDYPVQLSHMPERFGLFSIIVLGEGFVALTVVAQAEHYDIQILLAEVLSFALIICLWKLYFYEASKTTVTEQLRGQRSALLHSFFYGYGHYFLYASVMLVSVSVLVILEHTVHAESVAPFAGQLLHAGCAMFLSAITLIHWAAPESLLPRVLLMRVLCFAVSVLLFFVPLSPALELGVQVGVLGLLILGEYLTYRSEGILPLDQTIE